MKIIERTQNGQVARLEAWLVAALCGAATLAVAQPTRTNYFIGGANNQRWHQALNWSTDPLGFGAPAGDGTEAIVFYQSNKFGSARFNLVSQFPGAGRTNFYSITFTNGPFDAAMFTDNQPIRVGAGSITIEPQVSGSIQYRMPTYFDGPRTIANNSVNGALMTCEADNGGFTTEPVKNWILSIGDNALTLDGPGSFAFSRGSGAIRGATAGLTKNGSGAASLLGTNTFTGPIALTAGSLTLGSVHAGNNAVSVADLTTFGATVSEANSTLALSNLTLGNNPAGSVTNVFNLGTFGNPSVPVVNASSLAANGRVTVNVTGLGLSVGQITLLKCAGSIGGGAHSFVLGTLPAGREGQLIVTTDSVVLDITNAPVLVFTGSTNGVTTGLWDINGTSNWVDQTSGAPAYFLNGTSVLFEDTAATTTVVLVTNVQPFTLRVTNTGTYTFSSNNPASGIGGAARFVKEGSGTVVLATSNNYSGYTYIAGGTLQLAAAEAIGNGSDVTNNAVLQLGGFDEDVGVLNGTGVISNNAWLGTPNRLTIGGAGNGDFSGVIRDGAGALALTKDGAGIQKLSGNNAYSGGTRISAGTLVLGGNNVLGTGMLEWTGAGSVSADATPRTVTNNILINPVNRVFLGSPGAAPTTFTGNVDLGTGTPRLPVDSDVVFSGVTIGNGIFQSKENSGTLTLRSIAGELSGANMTVQDGALVLDGVKLTNSANTFYVQSLVSGGTARLVVSNNAVLAVLPSLNLRIGSANAASTATNLLEVDGAKVLLPNGGKIDLGRLCARAVLNAKNGSLIETLAISHVDDPNAPWTDAFFDNATLRATADRATFIEGLSNAVLQAGGLTVDTMPFTLGVPQNLSGAGGLTKLGSGRLNLNGVNTYSGPTAVNAGVLGGSGGIAGPVTIGPAASLAPGDSIGTLTANQNVTLGGDFQIEVDKDVFPAHDVLVVGGTVHYGGTLTVLTNGFTPFVVGDSFPIVSAGGHAGTLTVVGSPGEGLAWDFNEATGVLSVVTPGSEPARLDYAVTGGQMKFSWTANFKLQAQTNSLGVGLSSNWGDYPGAVSSPVNVPVDASRGCVFFRLISQ